MWRLSCAICKVLQNLIRAELYWVTTSDSQQHFWRIACFIKTYQFTRNVALESQKQLYASNKILKANQKKTKIEHNILWLKLNRRVFELMNKRIFSRSSPQKGGVLQKTWDIWQNSQENVCTEINKSEVNLLEAGMQLYLKTLLHMCFPVNFWNSSEQLFHKAPVYGRIYLKLWCSYEAIWKVY